MNEKVLKCLYDIKIAIDEIESFVDFNVLTFEKFKIEILIKRAVERNLEIIGEAVSRILKIEPEFELEDSKRIIGLRNQIIHGYDTISDENIWAVLTIHLPKLKIEINKFIE